MLEDGAIDDPIDEATDEAIDEAIDDALEDDVPSTATACVGALRAQAVETIAATRATKLDELFLRVRATIERWHGRPVARTLPSWKNRQFARSLAVGENPRPP